MSHGRGCKEPETLVCYRKQIKHTRFTLGKRIPFPIINRVNLRTRYFFYLMLRDFIDDIDVTVSHI